MASAFQPVPKASRQTEDRSGNHQKGLTPRKMFETALRHKRILHVEFDRTLLAVRHALLETAGFEVISCFSSTALREVSTGTSPFDLVLVGHAAPVSERNELVTWMKTNFPGTTVIVLKARDTDSSPIGDISTTGDPEDLVKTIVDVLKRE